MESGVPFFPEQASTIAPDVDRVYLFGVIMAAFFTLLIFLLIVFFAMYYRRTAQRDRTASHGSAWLLETAWIVVPFAIVMVMFFWGAVVFVKAQQPPADALQLQVFGKQWMWKIQHPQGRREINTLHVPAGVPVRLRMISEDVIHSFFVPVFRVKRDVLPGRYSELWFEATRTGEYDLYCAEYCGTDHADMRGKVVVMDPSEYTAWLADSSHVAVEVQGGRLFEQFRCHTCHHAGQDAQGPHLAQQFGTVIPLDGGDTVQMDEAYVRESIYRPQAKVHTGFKPVMPTFAGQLDEEQVYQLVEYIKSLGEPLPGVELE